MKRLWACLLACGVTCGLIAIGGGKMAGIAASQDKSHNTPGCHPAPSNAPEHQYFERLAARPDCVHAYALRDEAELREYRHSKVRDLSVNYDPAHDADPRRQDAARLAVAPDDVIIRNQVRLPIDQQKGHSSLITWDYWMGKEWAYSNTRMGNSKQFNIGKVSGATYLIWQSHFQKAAPGTLALFDMRGPSPDYTSKTIPPPVKRYIKPETWTRAWWQIAPFPDGFHLNAWIADEREAPVQVYRNIRVAYPPAGEAVGPFWLEYGTSQNKRSIPANRGALVSYVRNVVILRDVPPDDVAKFLERPLPGPYKINAADKASSGK